VTFQYDFLIVLSVTILLGIMLQKLAFKRKPYSSKFNRLVPFAFVYFPTAIIYAFIANELPLRCFSFDPVVDAPGSNGLGPQSVSREGLVAAGVYIATVIINISVWLFALVIIIRHFTKKNSVAIMSADPRNNSSKSFLEE
jgi:hypothetical protein